MPFDFFNQLEHNNGTYQSADKNEIGRDCYSSFCRLLIQILYTVWKWFDMLIIVINV